MERVWYCKIGGFVKELPEGADWPLRQAVQDAFARATGQHAEYAFTGWGGELTPVERAIVNNVRRFREQAVAKDGRGKKRPKQSVARRAGDKKPTSRSSRTRVRQESGGA